MRPRTLLLAAAIALSALSACSSSPAETTGGGSDAGAPPPTGEAPYDMGSPVVTELWVDPVHGDDARDGTSEERALRTLSAAWAAIPASQELAEHGYRINLAPGEYPCEPGPEADNCINYFDARWGTFQHPVIVRAAAGRGSVTLRGGLNFKDVRYLYLLDLDLAGGGDLPTNSSGNNLLHLESGDHVLLRGLTLTGPSCTTDACNNLQEVLKVNQTEHLYVEESTIGGAWHSAVDWFVVQHGHVISSHLRGAGQWCMYVKGGSAYLTIEGNEVEGCVLGIQAGQSANLAMMKAPFLHHEAYDIKIVNNVIHDIPGVPLSVAGGYDVLVAHNTLYRVATSPDGFPLFQVVQGERNCTPTDELPEPVPVCQDRVGDGGWGPTEAMEGVPVIPARNVWLYDNVFYNPEGTQTAWSHFIVNGPGALPQGVSGPPDPVSVDVGLVIAGNVIFNGPPDHPLGIEDGSAGCQAGNATCNAARIASDNAINAFEPVLADPAGGDYRPAAGGALAGRKAVPIPDFSWADCPSPPAVPEGRLSNAVRVNRAGEKRGASTTPGAY